MAIFSRDPKRAELRHIPLFAALSRPQLDVLTRTADIVEVPAGTELIREGDSGHEFFAIAEGEVEISQGGTPIATEQAGDVFHLCGVNEGDFISRSGLEGIRQVLPPL